MAKTSTERSRACRERKQAQISLVQQTLFSSAEKVREHRFRQKAFKCDFPHISATYEVLPAIAQRVVDAPTPLTTVETSFTPVINRRKLEKEKELPYILHNNLVSELSEEDDDQYEYCMANVEICQVWIKEEPDIELSTVNPLGNNGPLLNKRFTCFHCGVSSKDKQWIRTHIEEEHINGPSKQQELIDSEKKQLFECPYCFYTSPFSSTLKSHLSSKHFDKKPHTCPHCGIKANAAHCFRHHMLTVHSDLEHYPCPYCVYLSSDPAILKHHIIMKHKNGTPFQCPHCEYQATQLNHLKQHVKVKHTNGVPFQCPFCTYKCSQNGHLKIHIVNKHAAIKPHQCPHCFYSSARSSDLRRHVLAKHTNQYRYQCLYCPYKTVDAGNFKKHVVRLHTNINPG